MYESDLRLRAEAEHLWMTVQNGFNTPSASFSSMLVPKINLIGPTPNRPFPNTFSSTDTIASPPVGVLSHRVLYRGSLSFVHSNADIPLEGTRFLAQNVQLSLNIGFFRNMLCCSLRFCLPNTFCSAVVAASTRSRVPKRTHHTQYYIHNTHRIT